VGRYKPKTFILSGGVAANKQLRERLQAEIKESSPGTAYLVPEISLCTDNAAMIGAVAFYREKKQASLDFSAEPNLSF
jgi:N6-L-threonylcarbamoyladenine synthase